MEYSTDDLIFKSIQTYTSLNSNRIQKILNAVSYIITNNIYGDFVVVNDAIFIAVILKMKQLNAEDRNIHIYGGQSIPTCEYHNSRYYDDYTEIPKSIALLYDNSDDIIDNFTHNMSYNSLIINDKLNYYQTCNSDESYGYNNLSVLNNNKEDTYKYYFIKELKKIFHVYQEIQHVIGSRCYPYNYLHNNFNKSYDPELFTQQMSLYMSCQKHVYKILEIGVKDCSSALIFLMGNEETNIIGFDIEKDDAVEKAVNVINKTFNNKYTLIKAKSYSEILNLPLQKFDVIHINEVMDYSSLYWVILNIMRLCGNKTRIIINGSTEIDVVNAIKSHSKLIIPIGGCDTHQIFYTQSTKDCDNNLTIVTALYDLRQLEASQSKERKNIDDYIEKGKFLSTLPYNMVIFTDIYLYDKIAELRRNLEHQTLIIVKEFSETFYYKYLDKTRHLMDKYTIYNRSGGKDTLLYIILNHNKFYFMEETIKLDPFSSTKYMWMDFGITHVAQNQESIHRWITNVPDKIKQMMIMPYVESPPPKEYFKHIRHNVAGGLFSGAKLNILKYIQLYKKYCLQIMDEEWYQLDEAIMTMIIRDHPSLFELYYGDYAGIISNYDCPLHNIDLNIRAIQKCLDAKCYFIANNYLEYMASYWKYHPTDWIRYFQFKVINDFYMREDKNLDPYIVDELQTHPEKYSQFISNNRHNLLFYSNTKLLIK